MDSIEFRIAGDDLQFVEMHLGAGQTAVGEPGAMMYMDEGVTMDTVLGDGSKRSNFLVRLWRGIKRMFTGESMFTCVFHNPAGQPKRVAFAAPYAGKIVPIDLGAVGGQLICQRGAFLCASQGMELGVAFQKRLRAGFFGGEGFIMQRLSGDGPAFVHASGMLSEMRLEAGQTLRVDTGCLVALQTSVQYDIRFAGRVKTALFGGEGLFFATLRGPGTVWLQSLPVRRMASRLIADGFRARSGSFGARLYLIIFIAVILISLFMGPPA